MVQRPSLVQIQKEIRLGKTTSVQIVEQCLERIERLDAQLRAWVVVDASGALRTAYEADIAAKRGEFWGPLHGIPLGIKDIIDVRGLPTRAGSPLRQRHIAADDAPIVASLRTAGAIFLGKTVTTQFACFDPPATRNPWDPKLEHTPGGSSSGSAVAVAAAMCLGTIGTQTGGSLIRPASYCGIAACKPTFGRLAVDAVVPVSQHLDHVGPLAASAHDLQTLLYCMGSHIFHVPGHIGPPRLGLIEPYFMEQADSAVRSVIEDAISVLQQGGASVTTIGLPPGFEQVHQMHWLIMAADAATYHRPWFPSQRAMYGPNIASLLEKGLSVSDAEYSAALGHRQQFRKQIVPRLHRFDAFIMPATESTAPCSLETTGSPRFQIPWSYAGLPAVSIPCGLSADRMPVALQLVANFNCDAALLQVAQWCEQRLGFHQQPLL